LLTAGGDHEAAPPEVTEAASILLVDDRPANLLALEAALAPLGQQLVSALSGEEALLLVRERDFAVVLLDIMMPGVNGLETARALRSLPRGREVPIIFITAGDTPAIAGYARGAVDVLRKPLDAEVVRAKVSVFVELFRVRDQLRQHSLRLAAQERAGQARIAALLNASFDGIIGMDSGARITEFNGAAETMFGRSRDDVLGRPLADLLAPAHRSEASRGALVGGLLDGDRLDMRFEVTAVRADGREFPLELAVRRIAAQGLPTFLGYARDLTVPREAERERARLDRERAFLAQASEAFASSLDYETTLQTVVRLAVAHIADWCAVDIVASDSGEVVQLAVSHVDPAKVALALELRRRYPPDPSATTGVAEVLRSGRSQLYEDIPSEALERVARDEEHLRILTELGLRSAIIVPIAGHARPLGAITFVAAESGRHYDRADLATAEELARRAAMAIENARLYRATRLGEARNRFLADATEALSASLDYIATLERVARLAVPTIAESAAVYRLDEDGGIRMMALAARDPAWEAAARELDTLLPLHIDQQDRMLPRVVRSGRSEMLPDLPHGMLETWSPTTRAQELVRQLAIRSFMVVPLVARGAVMGALSLTTAASGRRFEPDDLALAEELARRAGLAVENARLYREAQEANRLKDEFLATVSHELRTPLTAILGWIHLLKTGRPAQVERAIETIERNANAQAHIVDDVLDVSRIITGKLHLESERVNLVKILGAAVDAVRPAAEAKGIDLLMSLDPVAADTSGDAARLQQVAWNLLSNAIKFTPKGGHIEVRLERAGNEAHLRVRDDGEGIRKEFLPHVFERFRQGDSTSTRAHGGLGLGLSIVRHLVELHGGQVSAESDGEGRGSTFTVRLPMSEPFSSRRSSSPPASPPPDGALRISGRLEGLSVLVVDDDADTRDFLAALLEQHGAQATTAPSVREAIGVLQQLTPDVLVSDIGMPGADGYTLIHEVRELGTQRGFWFPAIAITAHTRLEDREQALSAGYHLHLTKPIDPAALVDAIAELGPARISSGLS
jgi:PAS domain S-box-containing protein